VQAGPDALSGSNVSGNFQFDGQSYIEDTLIGANKVNENLLANSWFKLDYNGGGLYAGLRYEAYINPVLGYDPRLKGSGLAYRSFGYKNDFIDITAGNFYEQFGSGMLLRSYEERQLGFDNSIDGARVKVRPVAGLEFTALAGKMRNFWETSDGILRAADMNMTINDVIPDFMPEDLVLTLGASGVSRYQKDNSSFLKLPENVFAWSGRFALNSTEFALTGEYAYKYNDPCASNKYNYNPGTAIYFTGSYFPEGFGVNIGFHRLDNMDFRIDRDAKGTNLNMNYLPALSKQHAYRLMTMYPFATQLNGEIGVQGEITTNFLKDIFDDGHDADLSLNFSFIKSIDTVHTTEYVYTSDFGFGKELFYRELSLLFNKSFSKKFEMHFAYMNQIYNKDVLENEGARKNGLLYTNAIVAEALIRITSKQSLRVNFQWFTATQDSAFTENNSDRKNGDWVHALIEYSIAPHWFISIYDEYNYYNPHADYQLHYPAMQVSYSLKSTQIAFAYGRQRGGLLCVGGVCRPVPAANGFRLNVTTSF
jgi:hypothetical protein